MRSSTIRSLAVLNAALAAALLVFGTIGVVAHALLGWLWVVLAVVFTALAFSWMRALRGTVASGPGLAGEGRGDDEAPG